MVPDNEVPLLPVRPHPHPGEAVSAYMARLKTKLGVPAGELRVYLGIPKHGFLPHMDNWDDDLIDRLISAIGPQAGVLRRSFLPSWRYQLGGSFSPFHKDNCWIQWCPMCMSEPEPWFRAAWRLAITTCCPIHGCLLLSRCPACNARVDPDQISSICACEVPLGSHRTAKAMPFILKAQAALEEALLAEPHLEDRTAIVDARFKPFAAQLKQNFGSNASFGQPCEIRHVAHGVALIRAMERRGPAHQEWQEYWRFVDRVLIPRIRADKAYLRIDPIRCTGKPLPLGLPSVDFWIEEGTYPHARRSMRAKMIRAIAEIRSGRIPRTRGQSRYFIRTP